MGCCLQRSSDHYGPLLTEHAVHPGNGDYDEQLREAWGGPMPTYYPVLFQEWPQTYGLKSPGSKTALVTGGIGGIGFYVAKMLAKLGYTVILPGRPGFDNEAMGASSAITAAVPEARVVVPEVRLDLNSFQSVRDFAAHLRAGQTALDVLCLNAGRGGAKGDPRDETSDGCEAIMQVNAFSHFLLTAELMPLLRRAPGARVVSQTSGARLMMDRRAACTLDDLNGKSAAACAAYDAFYQYQRSKACNCLFTLALNEWLRTQPGVEQIVACVCDPGIPATGVNIQHDLGHSALGCPKGWLSTQTLHTWVGKQHAADGALPMVLACVAPDLKENDWYTPAHGFNGPPSKGDAATHKGAPTDPMNPASAWPSSSAKAFWDEATTLTGAVWQ